jgi:hypothetical protein
MQCPPVLRHVLNDEAVTRGLGDVEARMLVEWLVDWAELLSDAAESIDLAWDCIRGLCRRARAIGRFVLLWSDHRSRGAATQLAGAERFRWPLPSDEEDPPEMMARILAWENRYLVY